MSNFDIDVLVGGPSQAPSTYKTVVLKGNAPFGTQVTEPNTKYVIRWDFDLNGQTVFMPENCILEFDGGSLNNGTIVGNDTVFINVGDVEIWGESLTREGTWREHSGGGGEQVQSDWAVDDENDPAYIKNKPDIPAMQVQSDWNVGDTENPAYIKNKPDLAPVATSGDYNSLRNKPVIPTVPTDVSAFRNDVGYLTEHQDISGKADKSDTYSKNEVYNKDQTYNINELYNKQELANLLSNTEKTDTVIVDIGEAEMIELSPSDTRSDSLFKRDGSIETRVGCTIRIYEIIPGWTYYFNDRFTSGYNFYFVAWYGENGDSDFIGTEPYAGSPSVAVEYTEQPVTAPVDARYLYLNTQDSQDYGTIFTANTGSIYDIPAALEGLIPDGIDPETGKSVRANKLYRVRRPENTAFSEWAWNGYKWVWLATKDYGIDDEPTPDSDNMVKSSAVSEYTGKYLKNSTGFVDAFTDKKGRIYLGFYKNGDAYVPGLGMENVYDDLNRIEILKDPAGRIISSRRKDGTLVEYSGDFAKLHAEDLSIGDAAISNLRAAMGGSSVEMTTNPDNWVISFDEHEKLIIEKANSMTRIEWTPKRDCPTRNISAGLDNKFPQGVPVIGVPYSATYNIDKVIGFDVSLETFMTAVNNPYSLLYTEIICNTNARSDWGITYYGLDTYVGPYFGNICSSFTSYCAGFPEAFRTEEYIWLNLEEVIGKVLPKNAQAVKIGDFIYIKGHTAIVTAIKYNDGGAVSDVVVSEQGGNYAKETTYTAEEFNHIRIEEAENATLYRYPTPNKDMQMFRFDVDSYEYNDDICTFAGDKACFREGELIVLNYNLDNRGVFPYTEIELYKDDVRMPGYPVSLDSIVQSDLPEDQRGHAFKLSDGLTYGNYKACMSDGTNRSAFTEFKVIQTNVDIEMLEGGRKVKVDFSSANATPVSVKVSEYRGLVKGVYIFTDEDLAAGSVTIDVDYFLRQQEGKAYPLESGQTNTLKVFFKDEFGRVTNIPLSITFIYED